ncbi:MAG: hypothetical protein V2A78_03860 [bacterium]
MKRITPEKESLTVEFKSDKSRLLRKLVQADKLKLVGKGRNAYYITT